MIAYAKVYPSSGVGGGFEVRTSAVRILGIHKTKEAADAQAYAINMRRAEASRNHVARASRAA